MKKLGHLAAAAALATTAAGPLFAQELQFWSWRAEDRAQYQDLIKDFEAANPGITVNYETYESTNYFSVLSTALAGGTGPDVMMVRPYGGLETISNGGYLVPLDFDNVPALADFPATANASETSRTDGKIYAVSFASQTMLVLYNKDIFAQFGLSEPETWDDLLAAAEAIKAGGMMAFANGTATAWQNESTFHALTSSIMTQAFYDDLAAGRTDFTDPRYTEALTRYDAISKAYFPEGFVGLDYASAQQLFIAGMAGMFAGGSFELAAFASQNPALNLGVFAAPGLKAEDEKLVAIYYDGGYAANASGKHQEASMKFINFLASHEFGQKFANTLKNISPIPSVTFDSELLQEVADLNKNSIPYIMFVHFRYGDPSGSALLQSEIQKMSAGQTTPAEIGKVITEGVSAWYEPFRK